MIGTSPPIAGVGVTDEETRGAGHQIGSHKLEYSKVCPAADVMGEPDGIAKVIFDADSGLILGLRQAFFPRTLPRGMLAGSQMGMPKSRTENFSGFSRSAAAGGILRVHGRA
ncbi:MAG: hypothetical protein WCE23_03370 [Candidatus Binatus sp.]|uniref:hypothetical protein n=1 Tax=Candidatus Binatus sp. TaxID=2811406 RepID=UPI003C7970AC